MEAVKVLLDYKADIEKSDKMEDTPLIQASANGKMDVVKLLIERGANVNAASSTFGYTALMRAAERGHLEIVRLLIEKGADVHVTIKHNDSALTRALAGKHSEVANFLRQLGAEEPEAQSGRVMPIHP